MSHGLPPAPHCAPRGARPRGDLGAHAGGTSRGGTCPGLAGPCGSPALAKWGRSSRVLGGRRTTPRGSLPSDRSRRALSPEGRSVGGLRKRPPGSDAQTPQCRAKGAAHPMPPAWWACPPGHNLGPQSLRSRASTSARPPAHRQPQTPGRGGRPSSGRPLRPGIPRTSPRRAPSARAPRGPRMRRPRRPLPRLAGSRVGRPGPRTPAPVCPPAPGTWAAVRRLPVRRASAPSEAAPGRALAAASAPAALSPRRGAAASPAHARHRLSAPVPAAPPAARAAPRPQPRPAARAARAGGRPGSPAPPLASRPWPPAPAPGPRLRPGPPAAAPGGTHPRAAASDWLPSGRGLGRPHWLPPCARRGRTSGETETEEGETAGVTQQAGTRYATGRRSASSPAHREELMSRRGGREAGHAGEAPPPSGSPAPLMSATYQSRPRAEVRVPWSFGEGVRGGGARGRTCPGDPKMQRGCKGTPAGRTCEQVAEMPGWVRQAGTENGEGQCGRRGDGLPTPTTLPAPPAAGEPCVGVRN